MAHPFLTFLRTERDRLNRYLMALTASSSAGEVEIARLRRLTCAVARLLDQWEADLVPRTEAA
ncbi:hypothetical protein BSL82_18695 (plasmid) [Tardibacter chloracetimidivorans]|jgi:hypothetical protein|uniref:Uncharacterized protein n=2 Tax=Sphingomonadaceae TaxID=41297 RepID=A0A1L4A0P6_9SPHN|nr:hypothetical protein [Sphingobium baderi]API61468.1 hypothetical protein BSL82_18695 [Tardibacter chloracetimidivorans]KKC27985.1 hypothetical protein WP12_00320 [Sphingomonas sp. SRS2]WRD78511.1 hypothetical protein QQ987_18635 [Sphingobium baderi]WRD78991.1 hypothetical protein QQ987_21400 [Sphingobium baderi]